MELNRLKADLKILSIPYRKLRGCYDKTYTTHKTFSKLVSNCLDTNEVINNVRWGNDVEYWELKDNLSKTLETEGLDLDLLKSYIKVLKKIIKLKEKQDD